MTITYVPIFVTKKCEKELACGFPWIFIDQITNQSSIMVSKSGELAYIYGTKNQFLGSAIIDLNSKICARIISKEKISTIDTGFFKTAILKAETTRNNYFQQPFYRLLNYEGDNLGGLCIDRYDDTFLIQTSTDAMKAYINKIIQALQTLFSPKTIIHKHFDKVQMIVGTQIEEVISYEHEVKFLTNLLHGQKTGHYYDQRDNHKLVASFAKNKHILDCFCYNGGFGITCAVAGASSVTFIDSSALAISYIEKNISLNKLQLDYKLIHSDAEIALNQLIEGETKFDIVILDPPAYIKNKMHKPKAMKAYQKLAKLGLSLLKAQGYLFFSTCSHHMSLNDLKKICVNAANKSVRPIKLITTTGHAPDHPIHKNLPESRYLNSVLYQILL